MGVVQLPFTPIIALPTIYPYHLKPLSLSSYPHLPASQRYYQLNHPCSLFLISLLYQPLSNAIDYTRIKPGDLVWRNKDPAMDIRLSSLVKKVDNQVRVLCIGSVFMGERVLFCGVNRQSVLQHCNKCQVGCFSTVISNLIMYNLIMLLFSIM